MTIPGQNRDDAKPSKMKIQRSRSTGGARAGRHRSSVTSIDASTSLHAQRILELEYTAYPLVRCAIHSTFYVGAIRACVVRAETVTNICPCWWIYAYGRHLSLALGYMGRKSETRPRGQRAEGRKGATLKASFLLTCFVDSLFAGQQKMGRAHDCENLGFCLPVPWNSLAEMAEDRQNAHMHT